MIAGVHLACLLAPLWRSLTHVHQMDMYYITKNCELFPLIKGEAYSLVFSITVQPGWLLLYSQMICRRAGFIFCIAMCVNHNSPCVSIEMTGLGHVVG